MATTPLFQLTYPSQPLSLILTPAVLLALVLAVTRAYTTLKYRWALSQHRSCASNKSSTPTSPPQIPYTIPILGNALSFLAPKPGLFFTNLFKAHPRTTGACTLLLGGRKTNVLFSPSAVQALFKSRGTSRDIFNHLVLANSFDCGREDLAKAYGLDGTGKKRTYEKIELDPIHMHERINSDKLLRAEGVNELTSVFMSVFSERLTYEIPTPGQTQEVGLYVWLQAHVFKASVNALMGSRLLELYPTLEHDFFSFDRYMMTMFFGIPNFIAPQAYRVRTKTLDGIVQWHNKLQEEGNGTPVDPDGDVKWEPNYGSRMNRARQVFYKTIGLSIKGKASFDLGIMFALLSNTTPAVGWTLMHLFNPTGDTTLLPRVMAELSTARRSDGSLDIPTLISLPLLQSIFQEVLRLYTDVLVSREADHDLVLPIEDGGSVLIKKHSIVMAPTWLGHYDAEVWSTESHPFDSFYAERFLTTNADTGKQVFTMNGTAGKLFPFGGGKSICPGRVFAKQEVFVAVALILLDFDFEVLGYVEENGKPRTKFPGLRDAYAGSGVMAIDGDIRVRMKRRE